MEQNVSEHISFNRLYQNYQKRFVRFANAYVRDWAVAEDIMVEALMYYWENRYHLGSDCNVPAFVLTTIKHKCLNYLRHQQVHEFFSVAEKEYFEWELHTRINSLEACEPHELLTEEIQRLVDQTLNRLPENTCKVFMLNRYEGKSYKEIALLMNLSEKGVDYHMQKALKQLRNRLQDYFPIYFIFFLGSH